MVRHMKETGRLGKHMDKGSSPKLMVTCTLVVGSMIRLMDKESMKGMKVIRMKELGLEICRMALVKRLGLMGVILREITKMA